MKLNKKNLQLVVAYLNKGNVTCAAEYLKDMVPTETPIIKYKKRPVVVDTMLLERDNKEAVSAWCDADIVDEGLIIHTLEGDHLAKFGDYVIKGVEGEFYPCKPDIFAKTYELATAEDIEELT